MRFTRRRPDRPDLARFRPGSALESLERRDLLSVTAHPLNPYIPSDLPVYSVPKHQKLSFSIQPEVVDSYTNPQDPLLNNDGKIVSGKDRQGNEWAITVHGPGVAIVTDTTPNDGVLDDDINTIQLIGTNPHTTWVTGSVTASAKTPTDGTVLFRQLIANSGVKSIVLNGFSLTSQVSPMPPAATPPAGVNGILYQNAGIYLTGGVHFLSFTNILQPLDLSNPNDTPINIIIGDPSTPLTYKPEIQFGSIFNTVYVNGQPTVTNTPVTTPSVNIVVNGDIKSLDFVSSTQHPIVDPAQEATKTTTRAVDPTLSPILGAGEQFAFPIVGTTGRTQVQATGVHSINVRGSAKNVTFSRGTIPFHNGLSSMNHVDYAHFHGNADAVGIDSKGTIQSLKFDTGLGDPTGTFTAQDSAGRNLPATSYGIPSGQTGYPASGYLGGLVTAGRIKHLKVGPANTQTQTAQNPDFIQLRTTGYPYYFTRPGMALTNVAITTSGSIDHVKIRGNQLNSEIKAGFHYPSYAAGLQGTRARSHVGPLRHSGDQINGVTSSTYRPFTVYGHPLSQKGNGRITGQFKGSLFSTNGVTSLGNTGAGFYARHKTGGYLPPPQAPTRFKSVLVR